MHHGVQLGSFGRVSLATAVLVCLAQAQAQAQNYQEYYSQNAQVSQVSQTMMAGIEARLASLEALNGCGSDESECKEVDIQSKPNHQFTGRMFFDQLWMGDLDGAVPQPLENMTGFRAATLTPMSAIPASATTVFVTPESAAPVSETPVSVTRLTNTEVGTSVERSPVSTKQKKTSG